MLKNTFYVGARSRDSEGGIYRIEAPGTEEPRQVGFNPLKNVSYLIFSSDERYLFSSCTLNPEEENINPEFPDSASAVASFEINEDGSLSMINGLSAQGRGTCHLFAPPGGNFLYAVNYYSNTFAEFRLDHGRILELVQLVRQAGSGPHRAQDSAHPHYSCLVGDGKYIAVVYLGLDAILCYPFDPQKGIDASHPIISKVAPPGSGPRHMILDHTGRLGYLLNQYGNTLISMRYLDGRFEAINMVSTLPRWGNPKSNAAALRLTADERHLFVSNRLDDSVAIFELDGKGGMKVVNFTLTGGRSPRDINLLLGGTMLAAGHEGSNLVTFFDYDGQSRLTPNGFKLKLPQPMCVAPHPAGRVNFNKSTT